MKLKQIKVNGFGNLENKEITLKNGINIIQGKNESGKSTLLKFIHNMFFGSSKNKNGREISDYEKYRPWNDIQFSGKLEYELENKQEYIIFRDFNKRNPQIFNSDLEDISKEFGVDKTKGNRFFYEQTNIDEDLFTSSMVSMQQEVKIGEKEQNIILQKISNWATSGEDNVSLKKSIDKLNKKLTEEIGTEKTSKRPINIIQNRLDEMITMKNELEQLQIMKYELEEKYSNLNNDIQKSENELRLVELILKIQNERDTQKEKIKNNYEAAQIMKDTMQQIKEETKQLEKNSQDMQDSFSFIKEKKAYKRQGIIHFIVFLFIIVLNIIGYAFIKNNTINYILHSFLPIYIIFAIFIFIKDKNNNKMTEINKQMIDGELEKVNKNIHMMKNKMDEYERKYLDQKNEIEEKINEIENDFNKEKKALQDQFTLYFPEQEIQNYFMISNQEYKQEIKNHVNDLKIEMHKLEIDRNNLIPKLEYFSSIEEETQLLKEEYQELNKNKESIVLAKEILDQAYNEVKSNITPKFTKHLSKHIEIISDGKYKNVRLNNENNMIVELENGSYIPAESLSIGTIDQLYLALRFAILKEISQEPLPIILDESFAYYDNERLANILEYINKIENQVLIFTCTNREKEILESLNIQYNLIAI